MLYGFNANYFVNFRRKFVRFSAAENLLATFTIILLETEKQTVVTLASPSIGYIVNSHGAFADHVAIATKRGAMENWGLIVYAENNLLTNPETSSASGYFTVAAVIAHELAHQVYTCGPLVTRVCVCVGFDSRSRGDKVLRKGNEHCTYGLV